MSYTPNDLEKMRATYVLKVRGCDVCRIVWPGTFELALESPMYSRLLYTLSKHPTPPPITSLSRSFSTQATPLASRPRARLLAPGEQDRKRLAAGDKDD